LKNMVSQWGHPQFSPNNLFPAALLCLFVAMLSQSFGWAFAARIIPTIVGIGAILFCSLSLINDVFGLHERNGGGALAGKSQKIHMDIASKTAHLPTKVILTRGFLFFGWMAGFAACMALIGLIPTVPVFIVAFMRAEGREPWKIVIPTSQSTPKPRVHEGYEWLYVLSGRMRLIIGAEDMVLGAGEVAEFETSEPHWFGSTGEEPAEVLSVFGRPGERMHHRTTTH